MRFFSVLRRLSAAALVLGLVASPALYAKDKNKNTENAGADSSTETPAEVTVDSSGSLELSGNLSWSNSGSGGTVDWEAASGGPEFSLEGLSSLDLSFTSAPWFVTGGQVEAELNASFDSVNKSTDTPYLVMEDADIAALAKWYAGFKAGSDGTQFKAKVSVDGGIRVWDLKASDYDYQPLTATGDEFWFRVFPLLGTSQKLELSLQKILDLELKNSFLAWWDAEEAYDRNWEQGFKNTASASATVKIHKDKHLTWTVDVPAEFSWDSGLIVPKEQISLGLRTSLDLAKINRLRLSPLVYSYEAKIPGFDSAQAYDVINQLSGKIDLKTRLAGSTWNLELTVPWTAWDGTGSTDDSLAEWKLGLSMELGD